MSSPATAPFDALAPSYDTLRFLRVTAERLAAAAGLRPGMRVLDVATGTGVLALAAADRVGPGGEIVGVDLSDGMLEVARGKLERRPAGGARVTFVRGDASRLELPEASFDAVLCASALFVIPDPAAAVRGFARLTRPGGGVGFSTFGPSFLEPLRSRWAAALERHGSARSFPATQRLGGVEGCRELLAGAGLEALDVREEQLGYLASPQERWAEIVAGMEGLPLRALPPDGRRAVEEDHLAELRALDDGGGLWVDVPVLLAFGRRR